MNLTDLHYSILQIMHEVQPTTLSVLEIYWTLDGHTPLWEYRNAMESLAAAGMIEGTAAELRDPAKLTPLGTMNLLGRVLCGEHATVDPNLPICDVCKEHVEQRYNSPIGTEMACGECHDLIREESCRRQGQGYFPAPITNLVSIRRKG